MARTLPRARRRNQMRTASAGKSRPGPLIVALIVAAVAATVLWWTAGPPSEAWRLPDLEAIRVSLTATEVSDGDLVAVATALAWLLLGYLAVTTTLRALAVTAARVTRGARWARAALSVTNLITIPAVRRIVDGGLAGTLLVATWMPVTARAAVAADVPAIVALRDIPTAEARLRAPAETAAAEHVQSVSYTVTRGEDLWGIAQRIYGDGSRYVDLFAANRGRVMPGGEPFNDPRVLHVGWTLNVPLPSTNITVSDDGMVTYRVVRGDHLWGVAARFLGDGYQWEDIWQANRDRDMGGGWRFTNPHLIYPGWELVLPVEAGSITAGLTVEVDTPPVATPAGGGADTFTPADAGVHEGVNDSESTADRTGGFAWDWPSVPRPVVMSAAGFAVLGAAALFVHRAQRAGLLGLPSMLARGARRTGDAGRVALVSRAISQAIAEMEFSQARLVLAHESERDLTFTIEGAEGDGSALAARAEELASRLGCEVEVVVTGARRVELVATGDSDQMVQQGAAASAERALMLPLGTDTAGRIVYANLAGVGSVVIAGSEIERRQLLHSWLATLTTTAGADELALRADASVAEMLGDDIEFPHFGGAGSPDMEAFVDELEDAIQAREAQHSPRPLVAVFDMEAGGSAYEPLLSYGRGASIYFIGLADGDATALFGASVHLGVTAVDVGAGDDGPSAGGVLFTLGSGEQIVLDPVLVRRDTSPRWREQHAPGEHGAPPAPPSDEPGPSDVSPPLTEDTPVPFDWRRAIFEADDGAADDGTIEEADDVREQGAIADRERAPVAAAVAVEERVAVTPMVRAPVEPLSGADERDAIAPLPVSPDARGGRSRSQAGVVAPPRDQIAASVRQQALFLPEAGADDDPSGADEALIYVRCLGELRITVGGVAAGGWPYDKGRELLALLVAHGGAPIPRKAIAEALWPDVLWDASLKHMLANATTALRSVLRTAANRSELQPLTLSHERYQVPTGMLRSDLDEFEEALRLAAALPFEAALDQYERALNIYETDFLESESFGWVDTYRAEYRQRFVDGALAAGLLATAAGEIERAAHFYLAATERAPSNEDAARGLMRCFASVGNTNGVVKAYRILTEAIQREIGPRMGPAEETRALLQELTAGAAVG